MLSIDLDLFTTEDFDKNGLIDSIERKFEISIEGEFPGMVITYINDVKVDFVKMAYPILFPALSIDGIRMLDVRDIAPMKLKAITQRGSKKDFFDIFYLLQKMSLLELLELFKAKFEQYEVFHIIKSLIYFEDAEQYADPVVFDKSVTWEKVKETVEMAVGELMK